MKRIISQFHAFGQAEMKAYLNLLLDSTLLLLSFQCVRQVSIFFFLRNEFRFIKIRVRMDLEQYQVLILHVLPFCPIHSCDFRKTDSGRQA